MAGRAGGIGALPVAAICCLALILLAIASTIVLALIPIYLPVKGITPTRYPYSKARSYSIAGSAATTGSLNTNQLNQLSNRMLTGSGASGVNGGTITITGASVVGNGRRKRQASSAVLIINIVILAINPGALNILQNLLDVYVANRAADLLAFVVGLLLSNTTPAAVSTVANTEASTVASTAASVAPGRRRRESYGQEVTTPPLITYQD